MIVTTNICSSSFSIVIKYTGDTIQMLKCSRHPLPAMNTFSYAKEKKYIPPIKHKGIHLRQRSDIYRFMPMRLHMRSVHLLTCTCLRLQTDLLHTHERGRTGEREEGEGGGSVAHCSALSTRRSCSLVMLSAASILQLQYSRVPVIIDPHRKIE